jgi:putative transposase
VGIAELQRLKDLERENARLNTPVVTALQAVIEQHGRWGFWKCFDRLRALGHAWNHKRVYRVYCALGSNQVRRTKMRVPTREVVPLHAPPPLNTTWAMDFMGDSLCSGRSYRLLIADAVCTWCDAQTCHH